MRRFVVAVAAVAAALFTVPSPAQAVESHVDPIAVERGCLAAAQAGGASAESAAASCLSADRWTVTGAADADAAAGCVQAVQVPWKSLVGVITWGTLIVCDLPFVAVGAGTLYWNGLPVAASAGPATIPGSAVQFWTTMSPCALTGTYMSSVLATIVMTNGQATTVGADASRTTFIACP